MNTNPPSILSIDDDPLILKVLEDLVTRSGYQSVTTTNSDEALRYALDRKFAVVIADHNMPDMLGADLLHRFAQIQPSSSRILITGIKSLDVVTAAVNEAMACPATTTSLTTVIPPGCVPTVVAPCARSKP